MKKNRIYWQKLWNQKSKENELASMGRSSYSIFDFFKYSSNVIKLLSPLKPSYKFLDCGGGSGVFSWIIYPFVKNIYLIDFSDKLIKLANKRFKNLNKIKIFQRDIRDLSFDKKVKFDRILFGSVLQYLNDYREISDLIKKIDKVSNNNVKVLFTQNPDIKKKKLHLKSYRNIKNKMALKKMLSAEKKRLWIDYKKIKKISVDNGFKISKKILNDKSLYGNDHMFDFMIYK